MPLLFHGQNQFLLLFRRHAPENRIALAGVRDRFRRCQRTGVHPLIPVLQAGLSGNPRHRVRVVSGNHLDLHALVPEIPQGSFAQKLYAAYLSYLPAERVKFALNKKEDARGSFTEILKTVSGGQFSVNVSKPGITKGQHWHHSKWEFFIVVSGHALIRERNMAGDLFADNAAEVFEYEVWGDRPEAVPMLPGYTHSIINLSDTEELITVMWASECFDPDKPDTFYEEA